MNKKIFALAVPFLFCFALNLAAESRFALADGAGALYVADANNTGAGGYLQLSKYNTRGKLLWGTDYTHEAGLQLTDVVVTPGGISLLLERRVDSRPAFTVLTYSGEGQLLWEQTYADAFPNVPVALAVDPEGNTFICGNVKYGRNYMVKVWKYDPRGGLVWSSEYSVLGNAYAAVADAFRRQRGRGRHRVLRQFRRAV